jgi:hypothetical protein
VRQHTDKDAASNKSLGIFSLTGIGFISPWPEADTHTLQTTSWSGLAVADGFPLQLDSLIVEQASGAAPVFES